MQRKFIEYFPVRLHYVYTTVQQTLILNTRIIIPKKYRIYSN